ncbi:MAG TPA: hypothetical protein DD417_17385 [Elusimicrobia bacterium]|nr:hypothetical protein [Elusimicrobiota bacterium]
MHDEERHHHHQEESCPCCGRDPERGRDRGQDRGAALVDEAIGVWQDAFHQACRELQVELLKEKLRKAWGRSMDDIADQVVEMMRNDWKAAQGDKKAGERHETLQKDLVQKIIAAYSKGPR